MTNQDDTYEEEEYNEYDEFDDEEERGLSGFSVLVIGLVMIGAFISVVWIAYQQGMKRNPDNVASATPYVAAEPEPIKIENIDEGEPVEDREVYDVFDGEETEEVAVLAEGPEEPIDRGGNDTIGEIAANAEEATEDLSDEEVQSRIASLEEEDAANLDNRGGSNGTSETPATAPTAVSAPSISAVASALSGTHVVQVGAFRSDAEAEAYFARMQSKMADHLQGKSIDIERADLGDRGVYHRLRLGPFSSADAARAYCTELKNRGQDCLIKGI